MRYLAVVVVVATGELDECAIGFAYGPRIVFGREQHHVTCGEFGVLIVFHLDGKRSGGNEGYVWQNAQIGARIFFEVRGPARANVERDLRDIHTIQGRRSFSDAPMDVRFKFGQSITLEQLQKKYLASRGLVRECMRILEGLGMLQSQRRTGISVQPEKLWNVNDTRLIRWRLAGPDRDRQLQTLTELRLGIEPVAARLAALRASETERDELREAAAMMRAKGDAHRHDRHLQADITFHTLILQATHNEMYVGMSEIVREVLTARRNHGLISDHRMPTALLLHEAVMTAVVERDEDAAETAMHRLLAEVRSSLPVTGQEPL